MNFLISAKFVVHTIQLVDKKMVRTMENRKMFRIKEMGEDEVSLDKKRKFPFMYVSIIYFTNYTSNGW